MSDTNIKIKEKSAWKTFNKRLDQLTSLFQVEPSREEAKGLYDKVIEELNKLNLLFVERMENELK